MEKYLIWEDMKRTVEAHLNKAYKKLRQDLGEVRYYLLFFTFLLN